MTRLRLYCYVLGDDPNYVFPIDIGSSESITELKTAIQWKGYTHKLRDVPIPTLRLWKVSIAIDDIFEKGLDAKNFQDVESLRPTYELSQIFLGPLLKNHVHIVIKPLPDPSAYGLDECPIKQRKMDVNTPAYDSSEGLSSVTPSPQAHGLDERPIKRRKMDMNIPAYYLSEDVPPYWLDFHKRFWGHPLDPKLKELTIENPPEFDSDAEPLGDVLPDEPFLDINPTKRLLVRAEYIRVFNYVQVIHAEESSNERLAVITGHPGIGKTWWIQYALRRCLGEKQSVVLYESNHCYLFSQLGVTIIDPLQHKSGDKHTWCFVDCTSAPTTLDISICARNVQLYPIYITSPKESRWSKLHQQRVPNVIVMNPWTMDEMLKARVLYPGRSRDEVIERFHNAGPSARLCLQFTSADLAHFYKHRTRIIQTITVTEFERLIWDGILLMMDDVSHKITIVHRENPDEMETHIVHPVSEWVRRELCSRLREWEETEMIKLLKRFSQISIPGARGMTSLLFETFC